MSRTFTWIAASLGVLALAAVLLFETTTSSAESTILSGDGLCSRLTVKGGDRPTAEPDQVRTIVVEDGERFTITKDAGIWRARLASESVMFRSVPPVDSWEPAQEDAWTSAQKFGWCYRSATSEDLLARGSGTLTFSLWRGEGDGFLVN